MFENETVEYWLGYNDFFVNGVLVRTEWCDGKVEYFDSTGEYHREDGPAYIDKHVKSWYRHGNLHRLDGPAIIGSNIHPYYWIDGVEYSKDEFQVLTFALHKQAQNTRA